MGMPGAMLGDLKSFVTKSSVGEVAVGLSVGAAFTNVMTELMETGRSVLGGELQYAGLVQAVLALLAAAVFSLVLVIKPLARLKARADRVQTNLVAGATGDDAVVLPVPDEQRVDGFVGDAIAEGSVSEDARGGPPVVAADAGGAIESVVASTVVASTVGGDADAAAEPAREPFVASTVGGHAGGGTEPVVASTVGGYADGAAESALEPDAAEMPTPLHGAALESDPGTSSRLLGDDPAIASVIDTDADGSSPSSAPSSTAVTGRGSLFHWASGDADGAHLRASGDPRPVTAATGSEPIDLTDRATAAASPHSQRVTKVCPYCAFDIPAVASRCGYCTADLTDAQRSAGVVLVDERT